MVVETELDAVVTNHVVIEAKLLADESRRDFHHRLSNLEVVVVAFLGQRISHTHAKTGAIDKKMSGLSQTSKTSAHNEDIEGLFGLGKDEKMV